MEDPPPVQPVHHMQPADSKSCSPERLAMSTSPEHSRARSKKGRQADHSTNTKNRVWTRRPESYADGTRRGRSRTRSLTRSLSPESCKLRTMRRRRSRSPSRSHSSSAAESRRPGLKRPRESGAKAEQGGNVVARESSQESLRSRSKRRKKYRRRSDYAIAGVEAAEPGDQSSLRDTKGKTRISSEKLRSSLARRMEPKTTVENAIEEEDSEEDGQKTEKQ